MLKKTLLLCATVILMMVVWNTGFTATFNTSDLEGTWYTHQVVSGDAPNDDPRWGYGILTIDSTGSVTGTFTSSYGTESTSATVQIDSAGNFNIIGTSPFYGTMNDDKNLMAWIDGSVESEGNALFVAIKKSKTNGGDSNGNGDDSGGGCFITTLF
jgi:hypothetical protein